MTSRGLQIERGISDSLFISLMMAKRGGKSCAAGGPGQISCTNNSYSPGISMHIFPSNPKVRAQWVKFVRIHRPDFVDTEYSALCSVHFEESCFTRLRLSALQVNDGDKSETSATSTSTSTLVTSTSQKPREKRVLIRGSLPSIQTANKAPAEAKPSDRDRRRSKAVSKIQSLFTTIFFSSLLVKRREEREIRIVIKIIIKIIGKLSF